MKPSAYARAFGLDDDPLEDCVHLRCGYRRAPRSAAALALAAWTRDNADATAWLAWPEMRQRASLWTHEIIRTALVDTDDGAASLLGFQDQSCLVLLHHPQEPLMRPIPWVFSLLPARTGGADDIMVRRPHGTKFGQAVFCVCRKDETWLKIDDETLSRGLRNAVRAAERLAADTARIARSALHGKAPLRPGPNTPWTGSEPMLDFLPFVGWSIDQGNRIEALAQDLADWIAPAFDPQKYRSISVTLHASMPENPTTEPVIEIFLTTQNGTVVRTLEVQAISHFRDLMAPDIAEGLIREIGAIKGLAFMSAKRGHKPRQPRLAMACAETTQSNHRKLALHARFGAPRLLRAA